MASPKRIFQAHASVLQRSWWLVAAGCRPPATSLLFLGSLPASESDRFRVAWTARMLRFLNRHGALVLVGRALPLAVAFSNVQGNLAGIWMNHKLRIPAPSYTLLLRLTFAAAQFVLHTLERLELMASRT